MCIRDSISITLGGETTKADAEEIVRRVKQAMEDFWQEKKEEEYHERTLQGACLLYTSRCV